MSSPIGVVIAACGSVTRASTSGVVKMPTGIRFASTITIEPMRRSCIVRTTSATGRSGVQLATSRAATLRSGASMSTPSPRDATAAARRSRCDRSSSCDRWSMQKSRNGGLVSTNEWNSAAGSSQQKQSCSAR